MKPERRLAMYRDRVSFQHMPPGSQFRRTLMVGLGLAALFLTAGGIAQASSTARHRQPKCSTHKRHGHRIKQCRRKHDARGGSHPKPTVATTVPEVSGTNPGAVTPEPPSNEATAPRDAHEGAASSSTCAPAEKPADLPAGDGWITGAVYFGGGPPQALVSSCGYRSYEIVIATAETAEVVAMQEVPPEQSYAIPAPPGTYTLKAYWGPVGSNYYCPGEEYSVTVVANKPATENGECAIQ
jgi:hypothetical protein